MTKGLVVKEVKINNEDIDTNNDEDIDQVMMSTDNINEIENWFRKYEFVKKKEKLNYLTSDKKVLYYNDNNKNKSPIIGIINNGDNQGLRNILINEKVTI